MEKVIINSYEDFEKLVGQQIGVSEYVELSQERNVSISLRIPRWIISGFTLTQNAPKPKVLLRVPLRMVTSPFPCCLICGTRLLR